MYASPINSADEHRHAGHPARQGSPRWYRTLAFRLAVLINVTATVVLVLFWCIDYARERNVHIREAAEHLAEQTKVLRLSRTALPNASRFQTYLDDFCHQMGLHSSPGHHIIITDSTGKIVARAHVRNEPSLETEMLAAAAKGSERFRHRNEEFVVSAMRDADGKAIIVAQSLAPAYAIIRAQAISHAISLGVLGAAIGLLSTAVIWRWVRRPIHALVDCMDSVQKGIFTSRAAALGSVETRLLASGFNTMIETLEQNERARDADLQRARQIQRRLLPNHDIRIPGTAIAFQYQPTDAVGGDYLDVFQCGDNRWLIAIADVCGHGVAAALLATLLKTHARHQSAKHSLPSQIMEAINKELYSILPDGEFVTCLLILYNAEHGHLEYANAGHPPALIVDSKGQLVAHLKCTTSVLGILSDVTIGDSQADLTPGHRLIAYTDGVVECVNSSGQMFGNERLAYSVSRTATLNPEDQLHQMLRDAHQFKNNGRLDDDATILVLQRLDGADYASHRA